MENLNTDINYTEITIHDLEPISYGRYFVLTPEHYDQELKDDLIIALAKYNLGLKSFDYTKRKYFDSSTTNNNTCTSETSFKTLLHKVTQTTWNLITDVYDAFNRVQIKEETAISLGLTACFNRLINSYESSLFLLKNQYYFESYSINRLIFEQINYCFNLIHLKHDDFSNHSKKQLRVRLNPTDINKLKNFLPGSEIGRFYSYLSEVTQIDYKQIGRYLSYRESINDHVVTMKSVIQSIDSALTLLKIVDIHSIVFEYAFKGLCDIDFKYLLVNDSGYSFNPERQSKKLSFQYHEEFKGLLKSEELSILYRDKKENIDDDLPF